MLSQAKQIKDKDKMERIRDLIGEEKDILNRGKERKKAQKVMKEAKDANKERAKQGLEPIYLKKREIKQLKFKDKFEKLEKDGKLESFLEKKTEENDKKRYRR